MALTIGNTPDIISKSHSIRYAVFTEEQGIPTELDHDGKDEFSSHALATDGDIAVATARLYSEDGVHAVMARVAVMKEYRGRGIARDVVRAMIEHAQASGMVSIEIHAHEYLRSFYEGLGFLYVNDYGAVFGHKLIEMRYKVL